MSVGIPSSNPSYSLQSVLAAQLQTLTNVTTSTAQLSSGKRITTAAVDPSGLAIYNNLSTQSQGADTANLNITDAAAAVNVAQGATSTIQADLSSINSLAIRANDGFNSASDRAALNTAAQAQVQEINQVASTTNFNGTPLLDGTNAGNTPATAATASTPTNAQTNSGSTVVTSVSASAATTSGTFNVAVDNSGNANVTFQDSKTQTSTNVGTFSAGSSTTFNGTTLNFGSFSASDANATATVQTKAATSATTAPSASIQSGASAGQTTNVSFANGSTSGLGIENIDLSSAASATNAQGQINDAQTSLGKADASLGAQSSSLAHAFDNNNVYANNLTASASAIGDTNVAKTSSSLNDSTLQTQISYAVLARANTDAGHLNSFLSQYA